MYELQGGRLTITGHAVSALNVIDLGVIESVYFEMVHFKEIGQKMHLFNRMTNLSKMVLHRTMMKEMHEVILSFTTKYNQLIVGVKINRLGVLNLVDLEISERDNPIHHVGFLRQYAIYRLKSLDMFNGARIEDKERHEATMRFCMCNSTTSMTHYTHRTPIASLTSLIAQIPAQLLLDTQLDHLPFPTDKLLLQSKKKKSYYAGEDSDSETEAPWSYRDHNVRQWTSRLVQESLYLAHKRDVFEQAWKDMIQESVASVLVSPETQDEEDGHDSFASHY